ncbi:cation transporter [bacterium]|nr:cation transporter [bacterium]
MNTTNQKINQDIRITLLGVIVNITLSTLQLIVGIFGRSSAMIADAIHSFSDLITDSIIIISLQITKKPADDSHNYGHGKVETLASTLVSIALILVGFTIFNLGLKKTILVFNEELLTKPSMFALYLIIFSIIAKEMLYRVTFKAGQKSGSTALMANAWHHRSDAFSSIATLIGISGAIFLGPKWYFLDPLAAIIISFFILKIGLQLLSKSINELLEATLPPEINEKILKIVTSVQESKNPHNVKTRRIGRNIAIDLHIKVAPALNIVAAHNISTTIEQKLKNHFGENTVVYIHIEPDN